MVEGLCGMLHVSSVYPYFQLNIETTMLTSEGESEMVSSMTALF